MNQQRLTLETYDTDDDDDDKYDTLVIFKTSIFKNLA